MISLLQWALFQLSPIDSLTTEVDRGKAAGEDPCKDLRVSLQSNTPHHVKPGSELVLVTGGSGFIGSHTVSQLLELGYNVRVFDNLETGNLQFLDLRHPRLDFQYGDIMQKEAIRKAMQGVTGVIHLAAASKVLPSLKSPKMATFNIERNAVGTSNVLEIANETKLVKKIVYAASSTFYGNQQIPFDETDSFRPTSPYAASKYMGELQMITNDALYNIPTVSLRFFMVYGPRNPSTGAYAVVTGKFLQNYVQDKNLVIEGTGRNFRDFIHVKDVARACILGLQKSVRGVIINVGSGEAHSIKEVADLVSPKQEHVAARPHDLQGTLASTCKAKELLGFEAKENFRVAMTQLLENAKAGQSYYLDEMWTSPAVLAKLDKELPGFIEANVEQRAAKLRDAVSTDSTFVSQLLQNIS